MTMLTLLINPDVDTICSSSARTRLLLTLHDQSLLKLVAPNLLTGSHIPFYPQPAG